MAIMHTEHRPVMKRLDAHIANEWHVRSVDSPAPPATTGMVFRVQGLGLVVDCVFFLAWLMGCMVRGGEERMNERMLLSTRQDETRQFLEEGGASNESILDRFFRGGIPMYYVLPAMNARVVVRKFCSTICSVEVNRCGS